MGFKECDWSAQQSQDLHDLLTVNVNKQCFLHNHHYERSILAFMQKFVHRKTTPMQTN